MGWRKSEEDSEDEFLEYAEFDLDRCLLTFVAKRAGWMGYGMDRMQVHRRRSFSLLSQGMVSLFFFFFFFFLGTGKCMLGLSASNERSLTLLTGFQGGFLYMIMIMIMMMMMVLREHK
jgi:hypothetical protein